MVEPDCRLAFFPDRSGYAWEGKVVGSGRIQVVSEKMGEALDYDLNFISPWKARNEVQFRLAVEEGGTRVTWWMQGSLPFFLFWMKGMMKSFLAMDFRRGLGMMKDGLELGTVPSRLAFPGVTFMPACPYLGVRQTCGLADISDSMKLAMEQLEKARNELSLEPLAPCFALYHRMASVRQEVDYTLAIPVMQVPKSLPVGVRAGIRPAADVYRVRHTGAYRHLGNAWAAGMMHQRARVFRKAPGVAFELYENDPSRTPEAEWVTTVCFPARKE